MNTKSPTPLITEPLEEGDPRQLAAQQILFDYEVRTLKPMPAALLFFELERQEETARPEQSDPLSRAKLFRSLVIEGILNCTIEATRPEPTENGFESLMPGVAIADLQHQSLARFCLRITRGMLLQTLQNAMEPEATRG